MDYEEAFTAAGKLGRAQIVVLIMTIFMSIYMGWQTVLPVFVAIAVPFKCVQTFEESSPTTTAEFDSVCVKGCKKYAYASTPSSIISTYDLACGTSNTLATLSNSSFWASFLLASLTAGYLGDRFGRRPVNLICIFFYIIFSTASIFSFHIWFYIAMRFGCGFCNGAFQTMSFLIMNEMVDKKYLAQFGMFTWMWFPVGEMMAPGMGLAFKDSWRHQLTMVSATLVPIFICFLFVPESPLWLYSKGRIAEAQTVLRKIAKLNYKNPNDVVLIKPLHLSGQDDTISSSVVSSLATSTRQSALKPTDINLLSASDDHKPVEERPASIRDIFRTGPSARLTIALLISWFAVSLVYYGLTFAAGEMAGNIYVNSTILAAVEIPAALLFISMNKCGRKKTYYTAMFISTCACIVTPFTVDIASGYLEITFAAIGKCLVTGAFNVLFTYTPELYPTIVRATSLLLCVGSCSTANIVAPFIIQMKYGPYEMTPYLAFGICGVLSTVLIILWGKETLNRPLTNTLEEFYNFLKKKNNTTKTNQSV